MLRSGELVTNGAGRHDHVGATTHVAVAAAAERRAANQAAVDLQVGAVHEGQVLEQLARLASTAAEHLSVVDAGVVVQDHGGILGVILLHYIQVGRHADDAAVDDYFGEAGA